MKQIRTIKDNNNKYYRLENIQIFPDDGRFLEYKNKCNIELKCFDSKSDFKQGINGQSVFITRDLSSQNNNAVLKFITDILDDVKNKEVSGVIEEVGI
jgi:viroplasmin and RNaseH domain-containing protein